MVGARIVRLIVATMLNRVPSAEPLHLQIANAWAPDNKHAADLIRRALVLLADHELNASTFTVRCAASTGLNLYDAVIAGLAALKGPKHGGAGVLASRLVKTMVDHDVEPVIRERVALGERFAGFGHGVYKRGDPRAMSLLDALTRAGAPRKFTREIPERIAEATGEFVNIDYALAVLVHALRMPVGQRTGVVCDGPQRRLDRACQRAIAARQADPPPRALCRPGAGTQVTRIRARPVELIRGLADAPAAMPAADGPDHRTHDDGAKGRREHPQMLAGMFVVRQAGILMQHGDRDHARQRHAPPPRAGSAQTLTL